VVRQARDKWDQVTGLPYARYFIAQSLLFVGGGRRLAERAPAAEAPVGA